MDLAEASERKRGGLDEAIKYMEEAVKMNENPHWSRLKKLADLYFKKGEKEKALEYYAKAIDGKLKLKREG